jgi:LacI family transcriptional regulator
MPTIKDIAKASGVSPATVSQVLGNGCRPVHPRTRERVMLAAQSLDYSPNAVARGLVQKRMNTIGLVFLHGDTTAHSNPFLMGVLDGVLSVSTRRNQRTTLCTLPSWEAAEEHLPELSDGRCDGVLLLVPPVACRLAERLLQRKVPFVIVNGSDRSGGASCVDVDNVQAAYAMTEHLLKLGHRQIAFVHRKEEWEFPFVRERQAGYCQAMTAWGCCDPAMTGQTPEKAIALTHQPTALFCAYDALALFVLDALQDRGIRVPDDVSVAGFDDIPGAVAGRPALTTVRQPMALAGERAAEMLLELVAGTASPGQHELLTTELVFRQSTDLPRRRRIS